MGCWYIKVCQIFTSSRNDIKLQGAHNPLWINHLIIHISLYYAKSLRKCNSNIIEYKWTEFHSILFQIDKRK